MAILTYSALTKVSHGPAIYSGQASLEAGVTDYVAWKIPPACTNFARLRVIVPSAGEYKVESFLSGDAAYEAGTQLLADEIGANQTAGVDLELAPAGIVVVTCVSGAVVVEMEAR